MTAHSSLSRQCLRLLLLSRNHDTAIINNSETVLRGLSIVLEVANETPDEAWRIRSRFTPFCLFPFASLRQASCASVLLQSLMYCTI